MNLLQSPLENNNLPIFPAFFFPNIEYLILLSKYDRVMVESLETYPKQTFRNRAYIQSANGPLSINVPIIREKNTRIKTSEARISYKEDWNIRAFRTICSAYGKSPFFEFYEEEIKAFFYDKYDKLFDLNLDILSYFKRRFLINTEIIITKDYQKPISDLDFRCKFPINPTNINPHPSPKLKPYIQCFSSKLGFTKNLSSIDLLFNMGKESSIYINNLN